MIFKSESMHSLTFLTFTVNFETRSILSKFLRRFHRMRILIFKCYEWLHKHYQSCLKLLISKMLKMSFPFGEKFMKIYWLRMINWFFLLCVKTSINVFLIWNDLWILKIQIWMILLIQFKVTTTSHKLPVLPQVKQSRNSLVKAQIY